MPKRASEEFVEVWGNRQQHTTQHKVADIRNRCGDARVGGLHFLGRQPPSLEKLWEQQGTGGGSGFTPNQEFMSEDQVLQGTSSYIGTRTQGLDWRNLRDASMVSSHQVP